MERLKRGMSMLPAWILTAVVLAAILWLTLFPHPLGEEEIPMFPGADKVAHGIMFGLLTFVALVDWVRGHDFASAGPLTCIMMACISTCVGISIEYLQRAMEMGRSFDYFDMIADGTGAFIVALCWIAAESTRRKHINPETGQHKK